MLKIMTANFGDGPNAGHRKGKGLASPSGASPFGLCRVVNGLISR